MSIAKDRIETIIPFDTSKDISRVTVFIRREQLEGQSLDALLNEYIQEHFIVVRQVKDHPGVWGLTFSKNLPSGYSPESSNPYFISP